jgi:oxygen-independent coproporphyrinogen-3 oxidase
VLAEAAAAASTAPLRSLYLGGGTPGLLSRPDLERLLVGLEERFGLEPGAEVSLEANPTNLTPGALEGWAALGVNRLSVGVQTFHDATLKSLARRHNAADSRRALGLLSEHWEASWSADLLVGWPDQGPDDLDRDVEGLLEHGAPHISVYRLTVEPRTALDALSRAGRVVTLSDGRADLLDSIWSERLRSAGFERYEVSNFAVPGHRSRHNQVYWANSSYLGLGPGAASSAHPLRWRNRSKPEEWLSAVQAGRSVREACEQVAPLPRLLESFAIGLRTSDGLAVESLDRRFTPAWRALLDRAGLDLLASGLLVCDEARLYVPEAHLVKVDSILKEFISHLSDQKAPQQPEPSGNSDTRQYRII